MTDPAPPVLAELWRGGHLESLHRGHVVVAGPGGDIVAAWGSPAAEIFPRSSVKALQALPLIESGAAARAGLGPPQLALACASHVAAPRHVAAVRAWLSALELSEGDLACGPMTPRDADERATLRAAGAQPGPVHSPCSGKHAGFLTRAREAGGTEGYLDPAHPVQRAALAAFEEMTGAPTIGQGVDGCSAPAFRCTVAGLAHAAQRLAAPAGIGAARTGAVRALTGAMVSHPDLVAGDGRPATVLMQAAAGRAVVKDGSEGVYLAALPEAGLGVAVKIADGAPRAADAAIAALLVRLGVVAADDPRVAALLSAEVRDLRGTPVGRFRAAPALLD